MSADDRLERLWNATRPNAPTAEAWDRVWTEVVARVDDPVANEAPASPLVLPTSRRRWGAIGLIAVAQAAAVLLAVGLTYRSVETPDGGAASRTNTAVVRIDEGCLVLIRSNADALQITDLSPDAGPAGVDAWYLVYNLLESLAGPVVAMSP